MTKEFSLTKEEHKKLMGLYKRAENTPVVLLFGKTDLSKEAWEDVRVFMDKLAIQYGYDPATAQISRDSLEFNAEEA